MDQTIDIDFTWVKACAGRMDALLKEMEEPSVKMVLGTRSGSGHLLGGLTLFCNNTIEFHRATYMLIQNTARYLREIDKLRTVDMSLADQF